MKFEQSTVTVIKLHLAESKKLLVDDWNNKQLLKKSVNLICVFCVLTQWERNDITPENMQNNTVLCDQNPLQMKIPKQVTFVWNNVEHILLEFQKIFYSLNNMIRNRMEWYPCE